MLVKNFVFVLKLLTTAYDFGKFFVLELKSFFDSQKVIKMPNYKIILTCCLLSIFCLIMPAYHDFYTGWLKSQFYMTLGLFFVIMTGLFCYTYQNFNSTYPFRKYALTGFSLITIAILISASFNDTSDIPILGAMLLYLIVLTPIFIILELIYTVLQRKTK